MHLPTEPLSIPAPDASDKARKGIGIHYLPSLQSVKVKGKKVVKTMPARKPGETAVVTGKGKKSRPCSARLGRKVSKLAKATSAIVRSEAEQTAHCQSFAIRLAEFLRTRKALDRHTVVGKQRAAELAQNMRELCCPMFAIRFAVDPSLLYFVSANVLSDYKREGIDVEVTAWPVVQRFGLPNTIRTRDVDMQYVEQFAEARANNHAMGYAQNAWRFAHVEGDIPAERVAYHWLFHGDLRPCTDPTCFSKPGSPCQDPQGEHSRRRLQARELTHLAFRYLELEHDEERSRFTGSRLPHRMRSPTGDELLLVFRGWKEA